MPATIMSEPNIRTGYCIVSSEHCPLADMGVPTASVQYHPVKSRTRSSTPNATKSVPIANRTMPIEWILFVESLLVEQVDKELG